MAQTRTAKGTAQSKSSGTTLTLSAVSIAAGTALVVAVAWEDGGQNDKPSIKFGNRDLRYIVDSEVTQGDTVLRFYKTRVKNAKAKDISITWQNAKLARVMFASQITEGSKKDVQSTNNHGSAGGLTRNTGASVTTTAVNTLHIAAFAWFGTTADGVGAAGAGHTIGQSVSTTGGGAGTNIHLIETYETLTATGSPLVFGGCRATLTQLVARQGCSSIIAWKAAETYTITATYHRPWNVTPQSNVVVFEIEDSTATRVDDVYMPTDLFDVATDQQVTDFIASDLERQTDIREAENELEAPDTVIETRSDTFVNDTIVL